MRPPSLGTLFALAACLIISVPATALAIPPVGQKDNGFSKNDERYLAKYVECFKASGCDYGRNLVDDGLANGKMPSDARVDEAWTVMDRQLHPAKYAPEPAPASSVSEGVAAPAPVTSSVPAASGGACPASLANESTSPTAVNPSSGASGCIQAIPSTWAHYNSDYPSAADAPVSVQMEVMAQICADSGNDAWVAADPC